VKVLPPGIWDNPQPHELQAYREFVDIWFANSDSYQTYEDQYFEEPEPLASELLKAQAYGCVTEGSDSESGHSAIFTILLKTDDGYVDRHGSYPSSDLITLGTYVLAAANKDIDLPESDPEGTVYALNLGSHPTWAWFDFNNVTIPQGASINAAFVRFGAANGQQRANSIILCAEDEDYPTATPTEVTMPDKVRTTNRVTWGIPDTWYYDGTYDSDDISCVVQEVINRDGWSSGNKLRIFADPGEFFNETYSQASQLHVWYNFTFDETSSGGVEVGGSADESFNDLFVTSGGVKVSGSAEVITAGLYEEIMEGGVEVGGEAEENHNDIVEVGGGVIVSGEAEENHHDTVEVDGGVVVSGEADEDFNDIFSSSGGVIVSGEAENNHNVTVEVGGGVVVDGTADVQATDIWRRRSKWFSRS